ncbi:MAG: M48 family metallopeptidase [Brumimicrobium sp.]|nr:M48 family metallopeptidase [Brumimicrobium sp.]
MENSDILTNSEILHSPLPKFFIQFGSKKIEFNLVFAERKTLGITVTPEMDVLVKAPINAPLPKIKEKVKKRASWILKQQNFFLSFQPKMSARKFINGETHLYLGRQYRIKVMPLSKKTPDESIKLKGGFIEVYTNTKTNVKPLLEAWYKQKAEEKIRPLTLDLFSSFTERHRLNDVPFQFSLRSMRLRWGSCSSKGKITLNPELIKAPKGCIEYVITHELCHLIHYNHTQKFFDLQEKEMENWEKWKMKLERMLG